MTLARRLWNEYLRVMRSRAATAANDLRWKAHRERKRQALIAAHLPTVEKIARQVKHMFAPHLDLRDLIQSGCVGLVEAARRYKPENGEFAPFCYFRIKGAIIDANRRAAYREEMHDSVEAIGERLGYLPARVSTDRGPLPDELAAQREAHALLCAAVEALPEAERAMMVAHLEEEDLAAAAARHGRSAAWGRSKLKAAREKVTAELRKAA